MNSLEALEQLYEFALSSEPMELTIKDFKDIILKDLEILEIIKQKGVDVYALHHYICCYNNDNEALENYNKLCFEQETLSYDEYNLLKEWLENEK